LKIRGKNVTFSYTVQATIKIKKKGHLAKCDSTQRQATAAKMTDAMENRIPLTASELRTLNS
jgi:hypothetical protein